MTESGTSSANGVITGQPVVDFSHLTSAEDLDGVSRIEGVAAVVVPESLAARYAQIPTEGVAATIFVPDRANVRVHVGPMTVGGDGLGSAEDVLVIVGLLIITSPVTGTVPHRISVVGSVLAPRGSEQVLGQVLGGGVGTVSYYEHADGQTFKVLSGQVKITGTTLANTDGSPHDFLFAAGQVVVTGPVRSVGYAQVIAAGQLFAPEASREVLEPRLDAKGQTGWYRSDDPRVFFSGTSLGPDFFRLLDHPVSLIAMADVTFAAGVTEAAVQEKVADIINFGSITAPADLVPVLQVLTTENFGSIQAADGPGS
jgi:hypothetical protein